MRVSRRAHQILEVPIIPNGHVRSYLPNCSYVCYSFLVQAQTLIDLHIHESPGGFQDRSGAKSERYIMWLEKDLAENPEDPRTLYYLGHGHWEIFLANHGKFVFVHGSLSLKRLWACFVYCCTQDWACCRSSSVLTASAENPTPEHWKHLAKAQEYWERRTRVEGNFEEKCFAMIKVHTSLLSLSSSRSLTLSPYVAG